jgi:SnoaL-like domain
MELFTEDSQLFLVYMDGKAAGPTQVVSGRAALKPVFDHLNIYQTTTHFNGQSTVILDGESAQGVTYCLAHYVTDNGNDRASMIVSLRYYDRFRKEAGTWRFAGRKLQVDWIDTVCHRGHLDATFAFRSHPRLTNSSKDVPRYSRNL